MLRTNVVIAVLAVLVIAEPVARAPSAAAAAGDYDVTERSVAQLHGDLASGRLTSEQLTRAYLDRIAALDVRGPSLHSVIALDPQALDAARRSDRLRGSGGARGPLAGIPVLVKDNIETAGGTPTTAGSEALARNVTRRDAPLVARLRRAGAIVLGKTNLSEWANIRSSASISGWSSIGGLVKNAYVLDRSACGSSAGTGTAIAASLAAVGVGTETDGSITCPSSVDGLVGLKPTLGLVSRSRVVPISEHQDTPGPMGRSVADVAALLTAIAGPDPRDPATRDAGRHATDYTAGLAGASLRGKRLGVLRYAAAFAGVSEAATFARALATLRARGAVLVELRDFKPNATLGDAETTVLFTDLKADLDTYLATTPPAVRSRTLAAVIDFDRRSPRELQLFGQETFVKAEATHGTGDAKYLAALRACRRFARTEGLDRLLDRARLDALVAPTYGPANRIDVVDGDNLNGSVGQLPAVAGYPHLTVPMGEDRGLPVGLSFVGRAWSEASLLQLGAAYERASHARRPPRYLPSVEAEPGVARLLAPGV